MPTPCSCMRLDFVFWWWSMRISALCCCFQNLPCPICFSWLIFAVFCFVWLHDDDEGCCCCCHMNLALPMNSSLLMLFGCYDMKNFVLPCCLLDAYMMKCCCCLFWLDVNAHLILLLPKPCNQFWNSLETLLAVAYDKYIMMNVQCYAVMSVIRNLFDDWWTCMRLPWMPCCRVGLIEIGLFDAVCMNHIAKTLGCMRT